jgi:hypothetical protein
MINFVDLFIIGDEHFSCLERLFVIKDNWFSRVGYFRYPGWIWDNLIALIIRIDYKL